MTVAAELIDGFDEGSWTAALAAGVRRTRPSQPMRPKMKRVPRP